MTERKDLITAIDDFVTIHPEFDPQVREMMKVKSKKQTRVQKQSHPHQTALHHPHSHHQHPLLNHHLQRYPPTNLHHHHNKP